MKTQMAVFLAIVLHFKETLGLLVDSANSPSRLGMVLEHVASPISAHHIK